MLANSAGVVNKWIPSFVSSSTSYVTRNLNEARHLVGSPSSSVSLYTHPLLMVWYGSIEEQFSRLNATSLVRVKSKLAGCHVVELLF